MLQADPSTRYHPTGVFAIDDELIDHDGKLIQDVGWFWDHAEDRHKIAHDYLFSNYVCPSGKHYPLDVRRFVKRDQCQANAQPFQDHGVLCRQLIDGVCEQEIPKTFTFDSYFTNAENLNHIHRDGQQNLGMGDCQLRSGQGQTRHMYLVMLAYSLLMLQLQRADAKQWAPTRLTTIGQACRAVANATLRTTLQWAMTKVPENSQIPQHVIAQLGLI